MIVKSDVFYHVFDLANSYDRHEYAKFRGNLPDYRDQQVEEIDSKYRYLLDAEEDALFKFSQETNLKSSLLVIDVNGELLSLLGEVIATLEHHQSDLWGNYPFEPKVLQDLRKYMKEII